MERRKEVVEFDVAEKPTEKQIAEIKRQFNGKQARAAKVGEVWIIFIARYKYRKVGSYPVKNDRVSTAHCFCSISFKEDNSTTTTTFSLVSTYSIGKKLLIK